MDNDTAPEVPARLHRTDVGNNSALSALYAFGGCAIAIGILISLIANSYIQNDYDPSGAIAAQGFGGLLANAGLLLLTGGLVAHAINWQISRSNPRA